MAGVNWIRFDTSIFDHPKMLVLESDRRFRTMISHIKGLCYSGKHGLAGFIPAVALPRIGVSMADARQLVEADLWVPVPGGWTINGWKEYQLADEESLRRSEKAQAAARARWNK